MWPSGAMPNAGRGTRTPKGLSPPDFESGASTNSTIPARTTAVTYQRAQAPYIVQRRLVAQRASVEPERNLKTVFPPSAAPRVHFDGPTRKAGAVLYAGVRGGEVPHGFDVNSIQLAEYIEFATDNSIDHNSRIIGPVAKLLPRRACIQRRL